MGGIARYARNVQARKALFSAAERVGECVISGGAGMTAGLLLDHASMPMVLAASSIAGHMGTLLMFALESGISARLCAAVGPPPEDPKKQPSPP